METMVLFLVLIFSLVVCMACGAVRESANRERQCVAAQMPDGARGLDGPAMHAAVRWAFLASVVPGFVRHWRDWRVDAADRAALLGAVVFGKTPPVRVRFTCETSGEEAALCICDADVRAMQAFVMETSVVLGEATAADEVRGEQGRRVDIHNGSRMARAAAGSM